MPTRRKDDGSNVFVEDGVLHDERPRLVSTHLFMEHRMIIHSDVLGVPSHNATQYYVMTDSVYVKKMGVLVF